MRRIEAIRGGRRSLARLAGAKRPVFVQVVVREARARQRPLLLVAPAAAVNESSGTRAASGSAAHHEDPERRLAVQAVVDAAEPPVEPAKMQLVEARERRGAPELHVARV